MKKLILLITMLFISVSVVPVIAGNNYQTYYTTENSYFCKAKSTFTGLSEKGSVMVIAHLDDEIIWCLPWLHKVEKVIIVSLSYTSAHLNILSKYASNYDALWQFGRGITSTQEYKEQWLNSELRQEFITDRSYDLILRDFIADPNVIDIYTHNPWGSYGHLHHRQVSRIVRELAVEYGKTVWCPMTLVTFPGYVYDVANLHDFEYQTHKVDLEILYKVRQAYQEEPVNDMYPIEYWTWSTGDFYPNTQTFFKAVENGVDLTLGHPEIEYLMESLPVYGK